jgi:hypothetical protein
MVAVADGFAVSDGASAYEKAGTFRQPGEGARKMPALEVIALGVLLGLATLGVAQAHGADDMPDGATAVMADPSEPDTRTDGLLPPTLSKEARGPARAVIDGMKLWASGATLAVCFVEEATPAARQRIMAAAKEWAKAADLNIQFDFGDPAGPQMCDNTKAHQISISFKGDGSSSYVGTDSKDHEPSMVLGSLNDDKSRVAQDPQEVKRIVLHEFGHAIGLEHENQSPEAHCGDQIDWPKAEKYYQEHMHWSPKTVHENLETMAIPMRAAKDALKISGHDPKSIMQYAMPAEIFKEGTSASCMTKLNYDLSDTDRKWVEDLYSDQQSDIKKAMLDTTDKILKQGGVPDEERKAAIAKIGETFGITVSQTNNAGRDVIAPVQTITGNGNTTTGVNNSVTTNNTTNNGPIINQTNTGANSQNIGTITGNVTIGAPAK